METADVGLNWLTVVVLQKASALCYRIFDIAEEVNLERAAALLAKDSRRMRLTREGSEFVLLPNPPLSIDWGTAELLLQSKKTSVHVTARLYDHGALSVLCRVEIDPGTSLQSFVRLADELYDSPGIEELAGRVLHELRLAVAPAIEDGHLWSQNESYTVLLVQKADGAATAEEWLSQPELPRLLLGEVETTALSKQESNDVLQQHFSYTEQDLVVIDWNAAFVFEPNGSLDIPDLLEVANAQLLELRYYDDVLDLKLKRIYDHMAVKGTNFFLRSPYQSLLREMTKTLIDLTEFIERVENSLKIVGDVYLARVYESAMTQLRIRAWQAAVTRKQKLLQQSYELLKGEVDTSRTLTLEVMVVLLILLEFVVALLSVGFRR